MFPLAWFPACKACFGRDGTSEVQHHSGQSGAHDFESYLVNPGLQVPAHAVALATVLRAASL